MNSNLYTSPLMNRSRERLGFACNRGMLHLASRPVGSRGRRLAVLTLALALVCSVTAAIPEIDLPRVTRARSFVAATDLTRGGVIVVPRDDRYGPLADRLQRALQAAARADFAIETEGAALAGRRGVVIAVGNMMNNAVLRSLYWNLYTSVDPSFPGKGGWLIQTVSQPLPLLPEDQVLVLGGSDFDGSRAAVEAFATRLEHGADAVLPPTLEIHGVPTDLGEAKGTGLRGFRFAVDNFRLTGNRVYVDAALGILAQQRKKMLEHPDWVLVWGDEIDAWRAMQAWDLVQEFVHLPADQMAGYEQLFMALLPRLVERTEIFGTIKPGPVLAWNHTSIPLLGLYTIGRYYQSHYGFDLRSVTDQAQTYFDGQKANYRVSEDNFNYAQFSLLFVLAYYGMTDQWDYFDNGNAARMVRLLLAQVDNNGLAGGTGDAHDVEVPGRSFGWGLIDYRLGVPELLWFEAQHPASRGSDYDRIWFKQRGAESRFHLRSRFRPGLPPKRPDDLTGSVAIPLDRGLYDHLMDQGPFRMVDLAGLPKLKPSCTYEQAFDKLQFRSFGDTGGEYVLVDGLGQGNHGHMDTGSIVCCTLEGVRFLYDADYRVAKSSAHSMLTISRNGEAPLPVPPLAGLEANFNFADGAFANVRVAGYNGARWDRHLLWLKDRYFLVFDAVTAEQPGDFRLDCTWKVLDRGRESYDGKNLVCRASVAEAADAAGEGGPERVFHLNGADAGWWVRNTSAANLPTRSLHQTKTMTLRAGDMVSYQNIFYVERPDGAGTVQHYEPRRIAENMTLIGQGATRCVAFVGPEADSLTTDGRFVLLGADQLMASSSSSLKLAGRPLLSATSRISVRLQAGVLEIAAEAAGQLELGLSGATYRGRYAKGTTRLQLDPGAQFVGVADYLMTLKGETSEGKAFRGVTAPEWQPVWTRPPPADAGVHADFCAGDLDGDGNGEIVVATGRDLRGYDKTGREVWKYTHPVELSSCQVMPTGGGAIKVLAGTVDAKVLGFTAGGTLVKTSGIAIKPSGQYGVRSDPWITHLSVCDLDGDGRPEIVAGLRAWQLHVLNADLTPRWHNAMVLHGASDVEVGAARNGRSLLYVGDKYGGSHVFDLDHSEQDALLRVAFNGIGDVALAVADLNRDGVEDIISASDGGRLTAFDPSRRVANPLYPYDDAEAAVLWRYNHYGHGFSDVLMLAGVPETVVAASGSGYLYYLDAQTGKLGSVVDLADGISTIIPLGDGALAAGSESGLVYAIDAHGQVLKQGRVTGRVLKLQRNDDQLVVLDENGRTSVFGLEVTRR